MALSDFDNPEQTTRTTRVRLIDKRDFEILDRDLEVHEGPPIGPWVSFLGIRIALRVESTNRYLGIVPDLNEDRLRDEKVSTR